jgi:uridine phosphorylase
MNKEIPLLYGSPKDKALFTPRDFLGHRNVNPQIDIAVMYFCDKFDKIVRKKYPSITDRKFYSDKNFKPAIINNKRIAFIKSEIGGASSGASVEELIASGTKQVFFIGSCGTLQNLPIGSIIIPTKAIRDEGTSYHYATPSKYSYADKKLTQKLGQVCKEKKIDFNIGTTWTTDAPYRETIKKVKKYVKENVLCVEMEAASLFAIAKYRKISIAGIFWVSDQLLQEWKPAFTSNEYKDGTKIAFEIIENVLTNHI